MNGIYRAVEVTHNDKVIQQGPRNSIAMVKKFNRVLWLILSIDSSAVQVIVAKEMIDVN